MLEELSGASGVPTFREEYDKVLKALKVAHASERRVMMKIYTLNADLDVNHKQLDTVLNMSQEDQLVIETLKKACQPFDRLLHRKLNYFTFFCFL